MAFAEKGPALGGLQILELFQARGYSSRPEHALDSPGRGFDHLRPEGLQVSAVELLEAGVAMPVLPKVMVCFTERKPGGRLLKAEAFCLGFLKAVPIVDDIVPPEVELFHGPEVQMTRYDPARPLLSVQDRVEHLDPSGNVEVGQAGEERQPEAVEEDVPGDEDPLFRDVDEDIHSGVSAAEEIHLQGEVTQVQDQSVVEGGLGQDDGKPVGVVSD